ncbi:arginine deiminase-related protein [Haloarchaeobius sp. HME9146]|uniref:dimethylarginine dimethylaminohydrolase family protein n=1 Tax=Haloarchaeobius sp. HME9146 TaxID=2978732 RepID=UPI0021C06DB8|nr:arginine deiminase-related protein [Haloarchaeobius sp. HME9146]
MSTNVSAVFDEAQPCSLSLGDLAYRPAHDTVLLVRPTYFDVHYDINPYMGGEVDGERALAQWRELKRIYDQSAASVTVLDPAETWDAVRDESGVDPERLPDMVFSANHGLATPDGTGVILSRMATEERAGEPAHFAAWCREQGYDVLDAPPHLFEGTGDAIWHPGKELLWGGYGVRTDRAVYDDLAARLGVPVVTLELTSEHYYHLDVCFAPLDEKTVLIQPEAFTDDGLQTIHSMFERVLTVPREESRDGLACNCHCIDGETVVLGAGNPRTEQVLADAGYRPVPVETGEFQKAGGSVCCLKLQLGRLP